MGFLEKQLYQRIEEKYGEATKMEFIKNFKRFFDDCFIFWQKSRAELKVLFNMLNNINPKVQFTIEFSSEKLTILDTLSILFRCAQPNRKHFKSKYRKQEWR